MLKICKILSLNTALLFIGNVLLLYTVLTDTCIPQRRLLRDAMKAKCAVSASALTRLEQNQGLLVGMHHQVLL